MSHKLFMVADALGGGTTYEYPGFVLVYLNERTTASFGFANGPLGWNVEGDYAFDGESSLTEEDSVDELRKFIEGMVPILKSCADELAALKGAEELADKVRREVRLISRSFL